MTKKEKDRIQKANESIIARMKRGESLVTVPADATWFPPRPLIQKSKKDIEKLYGLKKELTPDETETD